MTARILLLRLVDGFFRRPLLYILPVLILGAIGFLSASGRDEFRSKGTVFVQDETFLTQLTQIGGQGVGLRTPAIVAGEQLSALLQTDTFVAQVIDLSGTEPALRVDNPTTDELHDSVRASILTIPRGQNFLTVSATWNDREVARELAAATIEAMVQWQIDADVTQSREAETFLADLVETYRLALAVARDALSGYLVANPEPSDGGNRPDTELVAIEAFQHDITLAETNLADALDQAEDAQLATAQAESDVRQGFLVDAPQLPTHPESGLVDLVVRVGLFALIGVFASAAVLVLTSVLDNSVRFPVEVRERFGLDVPAVIARQP